MASKQRGFTVVELMIAIAVFSVVILIATVAIIQIGRNFQQGATKTKMLDVSREIHNQFALNYQYSKGDIIKVNTGGYDRFCIGTTRYLYIINTPNELWTDTVSGPSNCSDNFDPSQAKRLLPEGAVVTKFEPAPTSGSYTLTTRFVIGSLDMFIGNDYNNSCQTAVIGGEFCAEVPFTTTVSRKVI